MQTLNEQWSALCEAFDSAREKNFTAFAVVNRGFMEVANGSGGNPTEEALAEFEQTWQSLEEVKRRMSEFVRANT